MATEQFRLSDPAGVRHVEVDLSPTFYEDWDDGPQLARKEDVDKVVSQLVGCEEPVAVATGFEETCTRIAEAAAACPGLVAARIETPNIPDGPELEAWTAALSAMLVNCTNLRRVWIRGCSAAWGADSVLAAIRATPAEWLSLGRVPAGDLAVVLAAVADNPGIQGLRFQQGEAGPSTPAGFWEAAMAHIRAPTGPRVLHLEASLSEAQLLDIARFIEEGPARPMALTIYNESPGGAASDAGVLRVVGALNTAGWPSWVRVSRLRTHSAAVDAAIVEGIRSGRARNLDVNSWGVGSPVLEALAEAVRANAAPAHASMHYHRASREAVRDLLRAALEHSSLRMSLCIDALVHAIDDHADAAVELTRLLRANDNALLRLGYGHPRGPTPSVVREALIDALQARRAREIEWADTWGRRGALVAWRTVAGV